MLNQPANQLQIFNIKKLVKKKYDIKNIATERKITCTRSRYINNIKHTITLDSFKHLEFIHVFPSILKLLFLKGVLNSLSAEISKLNYNDLG